MTNKKYLKIPTTAVILAVIILIILSFYSGFAWNKLRSTGPTAVSATANFEVQKSDKPELKFFVMSFCPYGNQMEDILRPVYDLVGNKFDLTPHYIFEKIDNLDSYCKNSSGDLNSCNLYIQNGYFKTEAECKKTISQNLTQCKDENNYIKSGSGTMYASLHGRQEANQNIREICAWNMLDDKKSWWNFIDNVNKNCTAQNADSCWESQAKATGLDTAKITECFNKEGINLMEKEYALTQQFNISASPTVLINDSIFPPESAYTSDNKGSLKIGDKVATQDKYRTPNVIKTALCAAAKKAPAECKTILDELSGAAPAAGGCN